MKTKQLATLLLFFFSTMQGKAQPISLHPENPHYFEYKGNPVILITSGEHYGAVINRDLDYEIYLHTLAEDGLNLTRIFCGTYVEHPGSFGIKHNTLAPPAESFLAPWKRTDVVGNRGGGTKFDLDRWDPEYFERLKRARTSGVRTEEGSRKGRACGRRRQLRVEISQHGGGRLCALVGASPCHTSTSDVLNCRYTRRAKCDLTTSGVRACR